MLMIPTTAPDPRHTRRIREVPRRERTRKGVALLVAAWCAACAPANRISPLPPCPTPPIDITSWELVERQQFSFHLPPGFQQVPAQGIDSDVSRYEADAGASMISFDLGWYSNELREDPARYADYRQCREMIGGRRATVITTRLQNTGSPAEDGRLVAAATWRNIGGAPDTSRTKVHLTVWSATRDAERLPQLLAMLRTVRIHAR